MKRRILAAIFTLLFAGACSASSSSGFSACDKFKPNDVKVRDCNRQMSELKDAQP